MYRCWLLRKFQALSELALELRCWWAPHLTLSSPEVDSIDIPFDQPILCCYAIKQVSSCLWTQEMLFSLLGKLGMCHPDIGFGFNQCILQYGPRTKSKRPQIGCCETCARNCEYQSFSMFVGIEWVGYWIVLILAWYWIRQVFTAWIPDWCWAERPSRTPGDQAPLCVPNVLCILSQVSALAEAWQLWSLSLVFLEYAWLCYSVCLFSPSSMWFLSLRLASCLHFWAPGISLLFTVPQSFEEHCTEILIGAAREKKHLIRTWAFSCVIRAWLLTWRWRPHWPDLAVAVRRSGLHENKQFPPAREQQFFWGDLVRERLMKSESTQHCLETTCLVCTKYMESTLSRGGLIGLGKPSTSYTHTHEQKARWHNSIVENILCKPLYIPSSFGSSGVPDADVFSKRYKLKFKTSQPLSNVGSLMYFALFCLTFSFPI